MGLNARGPRTGALLIIFVVALASLSACGGGGSSSSSSSGTESSGGGSSSGSGLEAAEGKLEGLYTGTYGAPPSSSPQPEAGKNVWVVSPSQSTTIAAAAASAAERAGKDLGWSVHVFDAKGDPNQFLGGVRQAIAAKAEGIMLLYIDCQYAKPGLEEAKKAGIEVVAVEAVDCSETSPGDPSLFGYVTEYEEGPFMTWIKDWGAAQATWDIVENEGAAKIVEFKETDATATLQSSAGFRSELATCSGCSILETVEFTVADIGTNLQQQAQQAFVSNPEANGVEVPYDGILTSGVLAAIRASGLADQMKVMGGEGDPANLDLIRSGGGQDAAVGLPSAWEAYAAMDGLNRLFAGEDPTQVKTGIGLQVIDREHNLPASGPYLPIGADGEPIDFEGLYAKAWGAG